MNSREEIIEQGITSNKKNSCKDSYYTLVWLAFSGISIGCLVGLSITPVVSGVISTILGLMVATLGVASGIQRDDDSNSENLVSNKIPQINIFPISALIIGIGFGSILGIAIRSNNLLDFNKEEVDNFELIKEKQKNNFELIKEEINFWTEGLKQEEKQKVIKQIFEYYISNGILFGNNEYNPPNENEENPSISVHSVDSSLLFSVSGSECNVFKREIGMEDWEQLKAELITTGETKIRSVAKAIGANETLSDFVEIICSKAQN